MQIKTIDLAGEKHWISGYDGYTYKRHATDDPVYQFIRKFVSHAKNDETVLEFGSYPGTYISEFGELNFVLNGIDIHPENQKSLKKWLLQKGYKVNEFYSQNIFNLNIQSQFDIVCSFGLIEHFSNFLELIDIHDRYLKPGGMLILSTPNYKGLFQKIIYKTFAHKDYNIHFIPSMHPKKWANHLRKKGYTILFQGYFGGLTYWISLDNLKPIPKFFLRGWLLLTRISNKFIWFESKHFSRFCGLVAIKHE